MKGVDFGVWWHRSVYLGMAPLLIAQGMLTRRRIPKLPEPAGARAGQSGSGTSLRLLIAGDSAAAGVGVGSQQLALSGKLVASLASSFDVQWRLIARTGYTTHDLLKRLQRELPLACDVAVLSLGTNDITDCVRLPTWLKRQRELVDLLMHRHGASHVILSSVAPLHEMTALPQPLRRMLGARGERFNAAQAQAVASWPGCEVVRLLFDPVSGALAVDGFHPGWYTYARWGEEVAKRIRLRCARVTRNSP